MACPSPNPGISRNYLALPGQVDLLTEPWGGPSRSKFSPSLGMIVIAIVIADKHIPPLSLPIQTHTHNIYIYICVCVCIHMMI